MQKIIQIRKPDSKNFEAIMECRLNAWNGHSEMNHLSPEQLRKELTDGLDFCEDTIHFVIKDNKNKVCASARMAMVNQHTIQELNYGEAFLTRLITEQGAFVLYGKLATDPHWQRQNLATQLMWARLQIHATDPAMRGLPGLVMLRPNILEHYSSFGFKYNQSYFQNEFPGLPWQEVALAKIIL